MKIKSFQKRRADHHEGAVVLANCSPRLSSSTTFWLYHSWRAFSQLASFFTVGEPFASKRAKNACWRALWACPLTVGGPGLARASPTVKKLTANCEKASQKQKGYGAGRQRAMALGARGLWRWAPEGYGAGRQRVKSCHSMGSHLL